MTKKEWMEKVGALPAKVIQPGEYQVASRGVVLQTLLGSCVAACLWDPAAGISGLNHFLLAAPRYPRNLPMTESEAGRYGINAMEILINEMMHRGADRRRLRAKIFGGASVLQPHTSEDFFKVHEVNQRFIKDFMKAENIPVEVEDLGGTRGRVIYFNTTTWKVLRRYIANTQATRIEEKEYAYWQRDLKTPKVTNITLW